MTVIDIESKIQNEFMDRTMALEKLVFAKDFPGVCTYILDTIEDTKYGCDFGTSVPTSYLSTLFKVSSSTTVPEEDRKTAIDLFHWFGALLASNPKFQTIVLDYFVCTAVRMERGED